MKLKNVTFTGADNKIDYTNLFELSARYPFIEWGILWYPEKMGKKRYPTRQWIKDFIEEKPRDVNISLHICGNEAYNFTRVWNMEVWDYLNGVHRVQLNFPDNKMHLDTVLLLMDKHNRFDLRYAINRFHALDPGRYVIIQANAGNKILNACLEEQPSVEFLFDESRGNGKFITEYPQPISRKFNGYAGGITPDNVLGILHNINNIVPQDAEIWIDIESGVRNDQDEFDLKAVECVCKDVESQIVGNGRR